MHRNHRIPQLLRFCVVGAAATAIQYVTLILGVETLGASATIASGVGFVISAFVNYSLNYRFTFASSRSHWLTSRRFAVVTSAGLIINLLLMATLNDAFHLQYMWAQIMVTAIVLFWNFCANALWSFK